MLDVIKKQKKESDSIQDMAGDIAAYAQTATQKVLQFNRDMKETKADNGTPSIFYFVVLGLQLTVGYFAYTLIKRRRL